MGSWQQSLRGRLVCEVGVSVGCLVGGCIVKETMKFREPPLKFGEEKGGLHKVRALGRGHRAALLRCPGKRGLPVPVGARSPSAVGGRVRCREDPTQQWSP